MTASITLPSSAAVALLAGEPAWVAVEGELDDCWNQCVQPHDASGLHNYPPSWATEALERCQWCEGYGKRIKPAKGYEQARLTDDPCKHCRNGKRVLKPNDQGMRSHDDSWRYTGKRVLTFEAECPTCDGTEIVWASDPHPLTGDREAERCPDCTAGTVTVSAHVVDVLPIKTKPGMWAVFLVPL